MMDLTETDRTAISRVLDFWFAPADDGGDDEARWFKRSEAFDRAVRETLAEDHERAAAGAYDAWQASPQGCLALVLLLDQVPRNLFRGDPRAFATDARARAVTRQALDRGFDRQLPRQVERMFLYMPLEHSEALADQEDCCRLMAGLDDNPDWAVWAEKHRMIVARFGRFPHRNDLLGRDSSAEERDFLTQPDSSF